VVNEGTTREIGDAVSYAIAKGIRIEILVKLNEGPRSPAELSRELGIPLSTLSHHVSELERSGCIEEAETRRGSGNVVEHIYRAIRRAEQTAEGMADMTAAEQRVTVGLALQNAIAEHLAAFRAGAMNGDDQNLVLMWDWFNLDAEGREEVRREEEASWGRKKAIEARSAARRIQSGEPPVSVMVSSISHPRVRPAPKSASIFGGLSTLESQG
jgi:DNA-binding HxlR family transcriptional regulator